MAPRQKRKHRYTHCLRNEKRCFRESRPISTTSLLVGGEVLFFQPPLHLLEREAKSRRPCRAALAGCRSVAWSDTARGAWCHQRRRGSSCHQVPSCGASPSGAGASPFLRSARRVGRGAPGHGSTAPGSRGLFGYGGCDRRTPRPAGPLPVGWPHPGRSELPESSARRGLQGTGIPRLLGDPAPEAVRPRVRSRRWS